MTREEEGEEAAAEAGGAGGAAVTVVSKPVPTFKPHWLRKDNPARGRRPKTPRTDFERKWFDFHTELHDPAPLGYRRQPKGRRAKSGQWAKRTPCPVRLGAVVEQTIKAMHQIDTDYHEGTDMREALMRLVVAVAEREATNG